MRRTRPSDPLAGRLVIATASATTDIYPRPLEADPTPAGAASVDERSQRLNEYKPHVPVEQARAVERVNEVIERSGSVEVG